MIPLEVPINAVSQLLGQLYMAQDTLDTGDGQFASADGPMNEFGTFDDKTLLEHHHQLAHGLVYATLKNQVKSLQQFQAALESLRKSFEANEETTVADVQTILDRLDTAATDSDGGS